MVRLSSLAVQRAGTGGNFIATTPGQGEPLFPDEEHIPDADRVRLDRYFVSDTPPACEYNYDFGDNWYLKVVLKKRHVIHETFYRRLTAGKRAYPIEDCGGLWGYDFCVACLDPAARRDLSLSKEDRESLKERKEWLDGKTWSPEVFDLEQAKGLFDAKFRRGLKRPYEQMDQSILVYASNR